MTSVVNSAQSTPPALARRTRIGFLDTFGLRPFRTRLREMSMVFRGDPHTPPSRFGISSLLMGGGIPAPRNAQYETNTSDVPKAYSLASGTWLYGALRGPLPTNIIACPSL